MGKFLATFPLTMQIEKKGSVLGLITCAVSMESHNSGARGIVLAPFYP